MKVAIYIRVSTDEQAKEGYSLDSQLEKLEAFCFSQNWKVEKIYREEGKSAKNTERPQLKLMLKELNTFDVVLVFKLDRLSRSVQDINNLLSLFEENNVSFKSATEPYDTTTPQGKLLINIFASLAQFEREQLAERVYNGMEKKAKMGERNGGRAPFGYRLENGILEINHEEEKIVKEIFKMYLKGTGIRNIALYWNSLDLGTKGIRSISRILSNPVYAGHTRWNKNSKHEEIIQQNTHKAIIDDQEFNQVQKLISKRRIDGKKTTSYFNFSGVLKCGRCGYSISGWTKSDTKEKYYICVGRKNYRVCDLPYFSEEQLLKVFLNQFDQEDEKEFAQLLNLDFNVAEENDQDRIKEIEQELERIKKRKKKWLMSLGNETITDEEFKEMTEEDSKHEKILKSRLEGITSKQSKINIKEVLEVAKSIPNLFEYANDYEKKQFINELFEKIVINIPKDFKSGPGRKAVPFLEKIELAQS